MTLRPERYATEARPAPMVLHGLPREAPQPCESVPVGVT